MQMQFVTTIIVAFTLLKPSGERGVPNLCCVYTCELDFEPDFCHDSCSQARYADGVDWGSSRTMLVEAASTIGQRSSDARGLEQYWELLTDAHATGAQTCEPAALVAELLLFDSSESDMADQSRPGPGSWVRWLARLHDPGLLALAGWAALFDGLRGRILGECGVDARGGWYRWAAAASGSCPQVGVEESATIPAMAAGLAVSESSRGASALRGVDVSIIRVLRRAAQPWTALWALMLLWIGWRSVGISLATIPTWHEAVGLRLLKDRVRRSFELLADSGVLTEKIGGEAVEPPECTCSVLAIAMELSSRIANAMASSPPATTWRHAIIGAPFQRNLVAAIKSTHRVAVCIVGQPRSMAGAHFPAVTAQMFAALCSFITPLITNRDGLPNFPLLVEIGLFFVFAEQPDLNIMAADVSLFEAELHSALSLVVCPDDVKTSTTSGLRLSDFVSSLRVDISADTDDEEAWSASTAYEEDAWWHLEDSGRQKFARQFRSVARCQNLVEMEGDMPAVQSFDWLAFLRPDLLHVAPIPVPWPHTGKRTLILPDGGQALTPQYGYIEGSDRAFLIPRELADVLLTAPFRVLLDPLFVRSHPQCLKCAGWRAPGTKLSQEKHLANVLHNAAAGPLGGFVPGLEVAVDPLWPRPLTLTAEGCLNARPCAERACARPGGEARASGAGTPPWPRWARELVVRHSCYPPPKSAETEAYMREWVQLGSTEGDATMERHARAILS